MKSRYPFPTVALMVRVCGMGLCLALAAAPQAATAQYGQGQPIYYTPYAQPAFAPVGPAAHPAAYFPRRCARCKQYAPHCRCHQFAPHQHAPQAQPSPMAPGQPSAPMGTQPTDPMRTSPMDPMRSTPMDPMQTQPDDLRSDTSPTPDNQPQNNFVDPSSTTGAALSSTGQGANTPMLGRADFSNRFNLFDTMSAIPTTRVWATVQTLEDFNRAVTTVGGMPHSGFGGPTSPGGFAGNGAIIFDTTLNFTQNVDLLVDMSDPQHPQFAVSFEILDDLGGITSNPTINLDPGFGGATEPPVQITSAELLELLLEAGGQPGQEIVGLGAQTLYRYGIEAALSPDFSIALQGQYHASPTSASTPDDFSNPLVVLKQVLYRDDVRTVSGVLGFSPETEQKRFSISENTSRVIPGLLGFRKLSGPCFMQWGTQFSLPVDGNATYGYDWAVSLGYWLYRHPSLSGRGGGRYGAQPMILAVIPQLEFLGHHVLGDTTVEGAFSIPNSSSVSLFGPLGGDGTAIFTYEEDRNVVDATAGFQLLTAGNIQFGMAVSVPVTGGQVRGTEFISTLGMYY